MLQNLSSAAVVIGTLRVKTHRKHCLVSLGKTIGSLSFSLVLVQPRKIGTLPDMTQKLLTGMYSNKTNIHVLVSKSDLSTAAVITLNIWTCKTDQTV